ncbi:UDP-4-amino-4,6-dideoxy-N-acetyl-beta-L-altrosamine transaminase [Pseudoalteromonas sp. GB56]
MKSYGRQTINAEDERAIIECLRSDFLTQGPKVTELENSVAEFCSVAHAVAVNSATSALHIACLALDVGPGDTVWTSANTFVASANCARMCGAEVEFVDIDSSTGNLSLDALEQKLSQAQANNRLPKVLIPVHFAGQSCDMQAIAKLVAPYDIKIIEDASHALGGEYQGKPVGCCEYSDISVFSFHPVKMITTAEGGMALTNNAELADTMRLYSSHGITKANNSDDSPPWYYEQHLLGYNYRMPDLNAALGVSQLKNLSTWVIKRNALAQYYDKAFAHTEVEPLKHVIDGVSSYHLYVVQVDAQKRLAVFNRLREQGVGVQVHYIPVYKQPYYQALGCQTLANTEHYYARCISLPLYPTLSNEEQDTVVRLITSALSEV